MFRECSHRHGAERLTGQEGRKWPKQGGKRSSEKQVWAWRGRRQAGWESGASLACPCCRLPRPSGVSRPGEDTRGLCAPGCAPCLGLGPQLCLPITARLPPCTLHRPTCHVRSRLHDFPLGAALPDRGMFSLPPPSFPQMLPFRAESKAFILQEACSGHLGL